MREIETKIIDFDEKALRGALKKAKAKYAGKTFYKRYVFNMHPNLHEQTYDEFVRLRTDGKRTMLTYKYREGKGLANTEEIELEVGDFEKTAQIIKKLWTVRKPYYQENIVEKWRYKRAEIDIVRWPMVKPYIEIEAPSAREVKSAIKELGVKGTNLGNTNLIEVFKRSGQYGKDVGDLRF